ncbi:MAG: hypothetical protein LBE79_05110 [Tannerella sp.]|jgi:hypothetical protein|nr:hypothetical protein [Tannerella sp.]
MKKYLFPILLLFSAIAFAQQRQIVEATSNDDLSGMVTTQIQFLFPEFTHGEVLFQNSPKGAGMLNYNMLVGEMQFMDNNTVMAIEAKDVITVIINDRKFFPYNRMEFTEELASTDHVKLRVRRKGNVAPYAKKGAYGTSSATSSITSYSSISGENSQQYGLSVKEDVLISVRYFFYLVGANGKYTQITNVKAFTKLFPAHRSQIEAYAKQNGIRFDRADDLKNLLTYCSGL